MNIYLGADHAGFDLKEKILTCLAKNQNYNLKDIGTYNHNSCNYPEIAQKLCSELLIVQEKTKKLSLGILICGSGIGMSMAANKLKGIRAALCATEYHAKFARLHNNASVLCLGSRITGEGLAFEIIDTFLKTEFESGRHLDRIKMFDNIE